MRFSRCPPLRDRKPRLTASSPQASAPELCQVKSTQSWPPEIPNFEKAVSPTPHTPPPSMPLSRGPPAVPGTVTCSFSPSWSSTALPESFQTLPSLLWAVSLALSSACQEADSRGDHLVFTDGAAPQNVCTFTASGMPCFDGGVRGHCQEPRRNCPAAGSRQGEAKGSWLGSVHTFLPR